MKRKILFLTMITAAVIWGCSDKGPEPATPEEGVPTYMSVSLIFPKSDPGSRAANDPSATDDEVAIKEVDILIYNEEGRFLSVHSMDVSKFSLISGSEDRYESTEQIRTTTGKKFIFAAINIWNNTLSEIHNRPMSVLSQEPVRTGLHNDFSVSVSGLPMFSEVAAAVNLSQNPTDPGNHVSMNVKRVVAKVTVEKSATMTQGGTLGTLGPFSFGICNDNNWTFMLQGEAPQYRDPNWISGQNDLLDFSDTPHFNYVMAHDLGVNPNPTIDDYIALYPSENTSEGKLKKEITRVSVSATFMPDWILIDDPDTAGEFRLTLRPGTITSPKTFYSVTPGIAEPTQYFYDKDVAGRWAAVNGGRVETYLDGYCYWDMFLNKDAGPNQWDVLRNDYYKCRITGVIAPGRPSPELPNPDVVPDADSDITTEINILFWNPVMGDYILEP